MKTRSFIIGWALVVLLVGACAVQAEPLYSYDFDDLIVDTDLIGQDNWVAMETWPHPDVKGGFKAAYTQDNIAGANRPYTGDSIVFTNTDTAVIQGFEFLFETNAYGEGAKMGINFGASAPYNMQFGAWYEATSGDENRFGFRDTIGAGHNLEGDVVPFANHWYEVRLLMDFSTDKATLQYRDLTLGNAWATDSILQNMTMGLGTTGPFTVDTLGMSLASKDTGGVYADNYYLIPEPSALALLVTGLIGLLCYAWRKRK